MTTSPPCLHSSIFSSARALSAGLIVLAACGAPPSASRLAPGVTVERELRGGQTHEYRLELRSGRYARLRLSQPGIDVAATLLDPAGERVAGTAGPSGIGEDEAISLVTARKGDYRLVVTPRDPAAAPGRYRLLLQELRSARAADGRRVAAERAMEEGRRYDSLPATQPLAIQRYLTARGLWHAIGDVRGEIDTLNLLGPAYTGDGVRAIEACRLAGRLASQAGYREGQALALKNLAAALYAEERYEDALVMFRKSFEIWREIGDRSKQHVVLQNIGQVHLARDKPREALSVYRRSLGFATNPAEQANALAGIGVSQYSLGDLGNALETLLRARRLNSRTRDGDNQGRMLGLIAEIYQKRGQSQEALRVCSEGLSRAKSPDARAYLLYLQANLLIDLGDLEQALANYQQALDLFTWLGNRHWEDYCRSGIGWVRLHQGDPRGALAAYDQIESEQFSYQRALVYWSLGQPARAAELLERALSRAGRETGLLREGEMRLALGNAYRELGRPREAAESLSRAADLGRRLDYPGVLAPSLFRLAQVQRDQRRLDGALALAQEALEIVESLRSRVAGRELGTFFFASRRSYYELYVDLLLRLDHLRPGRGYREAALAASEQARARVLLDLLAESRLARAASGGEGHGRELPAQPPAPLGLDQIRPLLDEDTALLEYTLGTERSTLFVVTRERLEVFSIPLAPEIDRKVAHLRQLLSRPSRRLVRAYALAAHRLYLDLIAPAAGTLAGKRRLVIAPDRSLYLLPFEALLTAPAAGRSLPEMPFLIARHSISYVPSASVLARLRQPAPSPTARPAGVHRRFVAFADPPQGGGEAAQDLPPLPEARREVAEIARLYGPGGSRLYLGADATEGAVKDNALVRAAEYLHFATHGKLDEKHPERSALLMARGPAGGDDGVLHAFEVFDLDLAADLVVLSACETGGKEVTGEGLVGLTRAFLYAGAPSVAVSLWPVADNSSADLMVRFYRELARTADKAGALRRSKLAMIAEPDLSHPFYWSSFVLVGDPGREP